MYSQNKMYHNIKKCIQNKVFKFNFSIQNIYWLMKRSREEDEDLICTVISISEENENLRQENKLLKKEIQDYKEKERQFEMMQKWIKSSEQILREHKELVIKHENLKIKNEQLEMDNELYLYHLKEKKEME